MYLPLKAGGILQHVKKLRIVNLQQHPSDLPSEIGVLALSEEGRVIIIVELLKIRWCQVDTKLVSPMHKRQLLYENRA